MLKDIKKRIFLFLKMWHLNKIKRALDKVDALEKQFEHQISVVDCLINEHKALFNTDLGQIFPMAKIGDKTNEEDNDV